MRGLRKGMIRRVEQTRCLVRSSMKRFGWLLKQKSERECRAVQKFRRWALGAELDTYARVPDRCVPAKLTTSRTKHEHSLSTLN